MKKEKAKFGKTAVIFIFVVIFAILLVNSAYYNSAIKKTVLFRKAQAYDDFKSTLYDGKIDYAFFGDSHAMHDVNPEFIHGAFVFATGAESHVKTYYMLRHVLHKDNLDIGRIFLGLDLHSFSSYFNEKDILLKELWYYGDFMPLSDAAKISNSSTVSLFFKSKLPFIGNGKTWLDSFRITELSEVNKGWVESSKNLSAESWDLANEKVIQTHFDVRDRMSTLSLQYLVKTIELAKKEGVDITFIKYPVSADYDSLAKKEGVDSEEFYTSVFRIVDRTGANYTVLDYHSLFFNSTEYFADPNHLNREGSEEFSKRLYRDISSQHL